MLQPVMDWGTGKESHDNWEHAEIRVELSDLYNLILLVSLNLTFSLIWFDSAL